VGGNSAGWDPLVTACIFVPDPQQTICSPEYPDPAGDCYKRIDDSRRTLHNEAEFLRNYVDTLGAVMSKGKEKDQGFQLYVTKSVSSI
jgi:hypothetical protein